MLRITDSVLRELVETERQIKALEKRATQIRDACRERGTFSTPRFVVLVTSVTQTRLAGLEDVSAVVGRGVLQTAGLIKEINFKTVKVEAKMNLSQEIIDKASVL
jgi:hypothetical protein